jgi:ferredoxin
METQSAMATRSDGSLGHVCQSEGFVVMRIVTDHSKCTGNALCAGIAPTVFDLSEEGYVEVLDDDPSAGLAPLVRRAAMNCPTGAITLIEDDQ